MAWIKTISEEEAGGDLKKEYSWVRETRGSLSNVMRAHSLDPKTIRLHMDLYLHLMFGKSTLTRLEREMLAIAVSQQDSCKYCITHHSEAFLAHSKDAKLLDELENNRFTRLSDRDRSMLEYAVKLTKTPSTTSKQDIEALRTSGFNDEEILRINLIVSYFNFVNRIVSGLGVQLEGSAERLYKY